MATVVVKRPARAPGPALPSGDLVLEAPPALPDAASRTWTAILMTLPMVAGSAAMALMFSFSRPGPLGYLTGAILGVSMLGMFLVTVLTQAGAPSKAELVKQRRSYMRTLARHRVRIRADIRAQRRGMLHRHPDPGTLWSTVASRRLWERRAADGDYGLVRIGLGPLESATRLVPPDTGPLEEMEPICAAALRSFVRTYSTVPDLPVALALRGFSRVELRGDRAAGRAMLRAMIAQVAAFHAPDDILVAVCCAVDLRAEWDWTKWLPHSLHPSKTDALGPLRLVAPTATSLEAMLDDVLAARPRFNPELPALEGTHVVLVIDDGDLTGADHVSTEGGIEGVTIVELGAPARRLLDRSTLVLEIGEDGTLASTTVEGREPVGRADALSVAEAEALARALAPRRLAGAARGDRTLSTAVGLGDLLGLGELAEYIPARFWGQRPNRDRLRVPLGVGPDGEPVHLDLKESAQDGMGPHGLLVGATGSGKSELLRTLVLALATTHGSDVLNFVLIDYKGGATFTKLDRLPHTSAVITNLADEIALVDRMHDAIGGELVRRQELLRAAGNFASQRDYERARASGAPLDPLPSLLVICDEFSELLSAKPDFIDMFVQLGRVGRSLGVHLLLASQRLDEGRLRGLETHLSYRIALRTLSTMESRLVLGVSDAFELPRSPGHALLAAGNEPLVRFRAAYVSGAYQPGGAVPGALSAYHAPVLAYGTGYVAPPVEDEPATDEAPDAVDVLADSELDVLVDRLHGRGTPARQVWLPPLDVPPTLDALLPPLRVDPARGLGIDVGDIAGRLRAPVGIVDRPFEQRREVLWVDIAGSAGHVAVVGGPQSGKSTLLRSLVTGLALTHTPDEVQLYCLDFGGGGLGGLRGLPHVAGVAARRDEDVVRRIVAEVVTVLAEREERFAARGIDSMDSYRRGEHPAGERVADIVLVIDGWLTLRGEFESLEPAIVDIANRGLSYGVHLVLSAARWMDLRSSVRDLIGNRLELKLGDASDSLVGRRAAMNLPAGRPGHGLTPDGMHFLAALPRIDGRPDLASLAPALSEVVDSVRAAWPGRAAPAVRMLPDRLGYETLPTPPMQGCRLAIGVAEADLAPVEVDLAAEPHLIVLGDVECGKSTVLRTIAARLQERYQPAQARILLVDYRRSLLDTVAPEYLLAYGSSAQSTASYLADVATALRQRLPGPDVSAEALRRRDWWQGPELFVLVDDYDIVANGPANPLAPLVEFVPQARDIGLHIVVTRRIGGASRAIFEPLLARMRESAAPGLLMSGNRDEGVLLGNLRPQPLPPGRGWLVSRRGNQLIQVAWREPVAV